MGDGSCSAAKFDPKDADGFHKWHQLRAGIINTQRKEAAAVIRRREGEEADQLLLNQGSAMWGCRQVGYGCENKAEDDLSRGAPPGSYGTGQR